MNKIAESSSCSIYHAWEVSERHPTRIIQCTTSRYFPGDVNKCWFWLEGGIVMLWQEVEVKLWSNHNNAILQVGITKSNQGNLNFISAATYLHRPVTDPSTWVYRYQRLLILVVWQSGHKSTICSQTIPTFFVIGPGLGVPIVLQNVENFDNRDFRFRFFSEL